MSFYTSAYKIHYMNSKLSLTQLTFHRTNREMQNHSYSYVTTALNFKSQINLTFNHKILFYSIA